MCCLLRSTIPLAEREALEDLEKENVVTLYANSSMLVTWLLLKRKESPTFAMLRGLRMDSWMVLPELVEMSLIISATSWSK